MSDSSVLKQFVLFAEYNRLMNQRIISAAAHLPDEELNKNRSAFFKSILGTLNHIMVGDILWLKRFAEHPASADVLAYISALDTPASLDTVLFNKLENFKTKREKIDDIIMLWVAGLSEADINETISYKNMAGLSFSKPYASLISHLFLHQAHHRGQVTTLLSQYGVDFGETDLIEIISDR